MTNIILSKGLDKLRRSLSVVCVFCQQGSDQGPVCGGCKQDMAQAWYGVSRCWCCAQRLTAQGGSAGLVGRSYRRPFRLCVECRRQRRVWQRVAAVIDYQAPWSLWLQELKMQKRWPLAWPMGELMAHAWLQLEAPRPQGPTLWVPIPARQQALAQRGFNPALELARHAVRQVPQARMLRAVRWQTVAKGQQQPQKWRTRQQRRYDLQQAFIGGLQVRGQDVVLVDDILTTGFTLQAAARACIQQGARSVWAVVFARTPGAAVK